ncbi:hypothetical protein A4A49_22557, partial [Nicotiana attenuata]
MRGRYRPKWNLTKNPTTDPRSADARKAVIELFVSPKGVRIEEPTGNNTPRSMMSEQCRLESDPTINNGKMKAVIAMPVASSGIDRGSGSGKTEMNSTTPNSNVTVPCKTDKAENLKGTEQLEKASETQFNMKPSKIENELGSTMNIAAKYSFVAPGAIRKGQGRGRGLRSLVEKENMPAKSLFPQSSDLVKQYIQTIETSSIGKGRGEGLKNSTMSASQGMKHKKHIVLEKDYMQIDIPLPPSTDQVKQYTQKVETGAIRKEREQVPRSLCFSLGISENEVGSFDKNAIYANQHIQTPSKSTRSNFTMSSNQEMRTMDKNSLVLKKEHMQTNILLPPSTDQAMKNSQTVETGSSNPEKVKRVQGRNKCKEVASLEVGQKLKVTFYNNRTVGTNSKLFSRHLGRIVRDRNMCPLGVSSWNDIKQEKLNHMRAAIEVQLQHAS